MIMNDNLTKQEELLCIHTILLTEISKQIQALTLENKSLNRRLIALEPKSKQAFEGVKR
jgi:hypothetical protein